MPAFLYRFYDASDVLLYVGITNDVQARLTGHHYDKPWFSDVARIDVRPCANRDDAAKQEKVAIRSERPLHNVAHAQVRRPRMPRRPNGLGPIRRPTSDGSLSLSVPEAAKALGIGKTKCWDLISRGDIGVIEIDGRTVVPRIELERYVAANVVRRNRTAA